MISVGSRDGRKGLGFGVEREMEETELEEGEACSYQDDDASIDPDVALSYIDEKIHNVLGHFQKDFEGGVSAENLGAKFGGYGSFLPTHPRSPVWSHPRTPPKVQNNNTPRSPNSLQLEGGHHNSMVLSTAPLPVRHGLASTGIAALSASKASSVHDSVKRDLCRPSIHAEELNPTFEITNKSANPTDQKTLKVRIKMGSDNLSTQKNAAIYSGLGLDVSPSSSLDDSPTESEGLSREPQDAPDESPTSILRIMTSYGGLLLSPLSDDLLRLTKKEKLLGDSRSGPVPKGGQGSSVMLMTGSDSVRGDGNALGEKKTRAVDKNGFSVELKNGNSKDAGSSVGVTLKKEVDIDTLACDELVSNALKLPLISNSYCTGDDSVKGTGMTYDISREVNKGLVRDKLFSDLPKEELLEPISTQEVGWVERPNGKAISAGKVWEDSKENLANDVSVHPRKDGNRKGEKCYESIKAESNAFKGRKALNTELIDPLKLKTEHRVASHEQNGIKLPPGKEHPSSGGKKKSKGSQSHDTPAAEVPKESLRAGSSSVPKSKKNTPAENHVSNGELENTKSQKDSGKARDRYRDLFGDMRSEHEDNEVDSLEMPSEGRLKDSEVVEKSIFAFNNTSKERLSGKKIDKPLTAEAYPKPGSNGALLTGNGPISDAAPSTVAPVVIEENWVMCDKCQRWRLLPIGTNPDNLPEKWLCSMLNWLPGMNRCSFSEEETTKALIALYQVPAPPESQNNLQSHPDGIVSGLTPVDIRHPVRNHQNISSHAVPSGGKKKHVLKEISDATNQDCPMQFAGTIKNLQPSVKSRSLNDVNQSPLGNEFDFQHSRKSSDSAVEKHRHKKKEKHKHPEHYPEGGDTKKSKMKSKRETDQDSSRASKKTKTEGMHCTDEDWTSDHGGAIRKEGPSSTSSFPTNVAGKYRPKYNDHSSSKDSKFDGKDSLQVSVKKPKDQALSLDDGLLDVRKCDNRDLVSKKRKVKESQDTQVYLGSVPSTGHHLQESRVSVEEFSENERRKEKKARVSKYEGKESSLSRGNGRMDKRTSSTKDQQLGQDIGSTVSQRSLDGVEPLKRDSVSVQPSVAATSSSSKVSGSHKTKTNFQEVKGSPVESVSSSPLRISNPDKLTTARRKLMGVVGKDELQDAGFFTMGSPRRCSDGEDDGGSDRSATVRKDKTFTVAHRGSLESSVLDFQGRDSRNLSVTKAKAQILASPEVTNHHFTNGGADTLGADTLYLSEPRALDQCHEEERRNDNHHHANGFHPRKSGKGSSSRSKDKNRNFKSEFVKGKISDSFNDSQDHAPPYEEKPRDGKNKFHEKSGVKSDKVEKKYVDRRDSAGKLSGESSKREGQSKYGGHDGPDVKVDVICSQDVLSTQKQKLLQDHDGERSSKRFLSDKTDRVEILSGREKSLPLPPSGGGQNDTLSRCARLVPGSHKGNGADILSADASEGDDALRMPKQIRKADNQNGSQPISSRHPTPNGQKVRDLDAPSPVRRDSSSQAATNAVKEAKDLKHKADRLKNSGLNLESTRLYFEAALKFLHGASLLESCNSESAKHGEMFQSMQMYSSTAKLCEFCAHEYERSKDMASAALAYKCVEVAYMRVIYSSHSGANRDRQELQSQTALQMVPPGESPSSSASDVDNLNNAATVDKAAIAKGVSSPQVAGNHVIAARNRPNFMRLLNFAQDVNSAMEASRKSRSAFAVANARLEEVQYREGISSIKRALDFNFQDVEGLLRLVRLAMEAIIR